jgi:argonaute-like protein implicated in RNA metabolism and viral defense
MKMINENLIHEIKDLIERYKNQRGIEIYIDFSKIQLITKRIEKHDDKIEILYHIYLDTVEILLTKEIYGDHEEYYMNIFELLEVYCS